MSVRPRLMPQCSACLQRLAFGGSVGGEQRMGPLAQQQVRGKKKMANNSATVTVRLNKDMPEFGRKGSLVPVSRGRMRNLWHPQRIANYVTQPELKQIRLSGATIERDIGFRSKTAKEPKDVGDKSEALHDALAAVKPKAEPTITRLTPARSTELLEMLVPKRLEFYRQAIAVEEMKEASFDKAGNDLFAAAPAAPRAQAIYGSVSTHDVLSAIRALLADNDEAARLTLESEEVFFVDKSDKSPTEVDKVKQTGDHEVVFRLKGADRTVSRVVRVISQQT